jgi:hypothetical protein
MSVRPLAASRRRLGSGVSETTTYCTPVTRCKILDARRRVEPVVYLTDAGCCHLIRLTAAPHWDRRDNVVDFVTLPAYPCYTHCRCPPASEGKGNQAATRIGGVGSGVMSPQDDTHVNCFHLMTSLSRMPAWLTPVPQHPVRGGCCSPGKASCRPDAQRRSDY